MKLLRETIRKLILESACDSVNDKIAAGIEEVRRQNCTIQISEDGDLTSVQILYSDGSLAGIIELDGELGTSQGNCHEAWIVQWSHLAGLHQKGLGKGALLYDVAIEYTGPDGLAADRDSVSDWAFPMWNYYYSNPSVYDKKLLDPLNQNTGEGRWTDDTSDDCVSKSWMKQPLRLVKDTSSAFLNDEFMEKHKDHYMNNPLNYVYTKKDQSQPTTQCLKEMELMK